MKIYLVRKSEIAPGPGPIQFEDVGLHMIERAAIQEKYERNCSDPLHFYSIETRELDQLLGAAREVEMLRHEIRDAMYKFTRVDRGVFPVALMDKTALQSTLEEIWTKVKSPTEKVEASTPFRTVVAGEDLKPGDPVVVKTPSPVPAGKVRTYDTWVLEEMSPQGVPKFIASYSSESMARHKLAKLSSATGLEYRVVKSVLTVEEPPKPAPKFTIEVQKDGNVWCALIGENLHDGVAGFGDTPRQALLRLGVSSELEAYLIKALR